MSSFDLCGAGTRHSDLSVVATASRLLISIENKEHASWQGAVPMCEDESSGALWTAHPRARAAQLDEFLYTSYTSH